MTGVFPTETVDHINHDRGDNRWDNLRAASQRENCQNKKSPDNDILGVRWHSRDNKWCAWINSSPYTQKFIGHFTERWDAICARKSAEIKHNYHVNHGR